MLNGQISTYLLKSSFLVKTPIQDATEVTLLLHSNGFMTTTSLMKLAQIIKLEVTTTELNAIQKLNAEIVYQIRDVLHKKKAKIYGIDEYGTVSTEQGMMNELLRGPIACGMAVTAEFVNYTGGIFEDKNRSQRY